MSSRFLTKTAEDGSYRHVLRLVVPMVLSNAAFTVMQFTDRILVARYSSEAIQAAMPAGILTFCLMSLFTATAGYAGTFVAQFHGAGDRLACLRACTSGVILTILFLPFFALLFPVCSALLRLAARDAALFDLENRYAFWMLLGAPLVSLHWVLSGCLTGRNRVVANAVVTTAGCAANVALDFWLIFGGLGVPALGLAGAGIATFVSVALQVAGTAAAIFAEREVRAVPAKELARPDWDLVRRIVRFGFPAGVQLCFDMASFAMFVLLTGRLDPLSLATSNIAFSVNNLAFSPLMGFSNAAAVLAGQFQGAGKPKLAQLSVLRCLRLAWAYMLPCAAAFLLLPGPLLGAFRSPDAPYTVAQMTSLGRLLLAMLAAWGMFDTMNLVYLGALKGAGDTRFVMAWLLGTEWLVFVPCVAVALLATGAGIVGAWVVQLGYIVLLSAGLHVRWKRGRWMSIDLVHPVP
ncbi:MAG: MATE family efflux transporter [Kiritimatiellae bacterium]|nr:MATE family efflux transporter [Kiritimatiellia bacterium]